MSDKRYDTTPKAKVKGHIRQTKRGPVWVREHVRELNLDLKEKQLNTHISDIEFEDGQAFFEINVYGPKKSRRIVDKTLKKHFGNDWNYNDEFGKDFVRYYVTVDMDVEY